MSYIVAKFGGWANSTADRVKRSADLFEKNPDRRIKINSAIGKVEGLPKVTDLLIEGAEKALKDGVFPQDVYDKIKLNHYSVFEPLGIGRDKIDEVMTILKSYIERKEELSKDNYRALVVGSGEELFTRLDYIYMKEIRNMNVRYVDPREIGHFLEGNPLDGKILEETYDNLSKLRRYEEIILYPGFFAVDKKGRPMLYSRGGTDKTAADVSAAVGADMYENWKDVDGVYSADPRIVQNPELMNEVTYKEIRELSYISFNVLHQEAMIPVMRANIPICLKNLMKPESSGTTIINKREILNNRPVVGIAHIEDMFFVNVEKLLMNEEIGFADKLTAIFKEHNINIEQITTGIDSMCVVVSSKQFREKTVYTGVAEGLRKKIDIDEFSQYAQNKLHSDVFKIRKDKALICVVGEGMRRSVGTLSRIAGVLSKNDINIEIIDQGPSERNVIIGVDCSKDKDAAKKAVNFIYQEFFN
ncbi:MAG TPA: aspartate kinase [Spirochaetota bacterium]|nr:aspartate kinase [Spirochaetota bacterium]HOS32403.1 aspartate kinase [Spirochaetota bacterium]HOS55813.1 aspartate kinase [Spirochaetota bacterium]HPK61173.1 aspartate kinase [Spirochaetota bacterium]HQF78379.1 aspartate kinase [Spirochaetota bacterium]